MNRRKHLQQLVALGLAPLLSGRRIRGNEIMKRPIPSTGEVLPIVGVGTWETFDVAEGMRGEMSQLKKYQ